MRGGGGGALFQLVTDFLKTAATFSYQISCNTLLKPNKPASFNTTCSVVLEWYETVEFSLVYVMQRYLCLTFM